LKPGCNGFWKNIPDKLERAKSDLHFKYDFLTKKTDILGKKKKRLVFLKYKLI